LKSECSVSQQLRIEGFWLTLPWLLQHNIHNEVHSDDHYHGSETKAMMVDVSMNLTELNL